MTAIRLEETPDGDLVLSPAEESYQGLANALIGKLEVRWRELADAIRKHRDSKLFRERTIADYELYNALPEGGTLAAGTGDTSGTKGGK